MSVAVYAPGVSVDVFSVLPTPGTGKITQFPLPPRPAGKTWPFVNPGSSKQCDGAYCPLNNRIYFQGGDTVGSATDGTYSVDATNPVDWRTDVGAPIYPTLPAPHALQDDFGIAWVPSMNQFLLVPGVYLSYAPAGSLINNYTGGAWWFKPDTNTYTQDTRYFVNQPYNGVSPGVSGTWTGCPYGGVFDPQTGAWFWFNDQSLLVESLDVVSMTRRPDGHIPAIPPPAAHPTYKGVYFTRPRPVLIGRVIYVMGFFTDGTQNRAPGFWGWNIDTSKWTSLTPAPVAMASDIEMVLNTSHGKVVWLKIDGPDGVVKGIYIYDPATNAWSQDTQVLPAGFMGNVSTSLPDGRIAFSGGVFGPQQTMFNFYEVQ